jgi:hypothetical protein
VDLTVSPVGEPVRDLADLTEVSAVLHAAVLD